MIPLNYYMILSAILFGISLLGIVINRANLIVILMCIELLLLAVNTNFIAVAEYLQLLSGEIFVFFILTIAAAESRLDALVRRADLARHLCLLDRPGVPARVGRLRGD